MVDQLAAHVRYRLGGLAQRLGAARTDEITSLVVRAWPAKHLASALAEGGESHRRIDHSLALMRARVREQWEHRHGIGPEWDLLLRRVVVAVGAVVLDLWMSDRGWRDRLAEAARE